MHTCFRKPLSWSSAFYIRSLPLPTYGVPKHRSWSESFMQKAFDRKYPGQGYFELTPNGDRICMDA